MILIEERLSCKLPNVTSLFIKLTFVNKYIEESLQQLPIMKYNKKDAEYEIPITKLFWAINLLCKYDDIKFKPYIEKSNTLLKIDDFKFKKKRASILLVK